MISQYEFDADYISDCIKEKYYDPIFRNMYKILIDLALEHNEVYNLIIHKDLKEEFKKEFLNIKSMNEMIEGILKVLRREGIIIES